MNPLPTTRRSKLGTPVWTTFEGRLGAVDEQLIASGRMNRLTSAAELPLAKRAATATDRVRRDPQLLVQLLLSPTEMRD